MITEKMREEFEKWLTRFATEANYSYPLCLLKRDIDSYATTWVDSAWLGWQASRAAIEVELPSAYQNPKPYACYEGGWNDMRGEAVDNIESLGLKVKPC